ncbi:kinase-like protein [Ascodesmis nigricans]|uniref:Kinase-like protein n=1 Tax=Ascodesmis nigricans TaxID=341454 RepID=A0A4S2MM05_9PEZI|nr:kinase-like protein [Ascodesmis nigricans]
MSMLQTMTATAGAATTNQRRSRATVSINGKVYRRLDIMGKGGSSKVYKVMAENYKMFAMKKVTFHANDGEAAIRGYKGEIELLRTLTGEDRVIQLYDWELNEEKQTLTMLMEQGETDLARILQLHYSSDTSRFDPSFVRHYWHEMLLCVRAVHRYNIIHSDLKPANFLLVGGRLKLIDFGIANAIQDDTVNVHRESQVGTLNYMSPEAIVDINASSGKPMQAHGHQRLMKIGAPSDMTYGQTPFAHLKNLYSKISAIPDPEYEIDYPDTGIGGARVPQCLVDTIKACLEREKERRPTIEKLLSDEDPFLHPENLAVGGEDGPAKEAKDGMVLISEDMLVQLLVNTVDAVERGGRPEEATVRAWARDVFAKLGRLMKR